MARPLVPMCDSAHGRVRPVQRYVADVTLGAIWFPNALDSVYRSLCIENGLWLAESRASSVHQFGDRPWRGWAKATIRADPETPSRGMCLSSDLVPALIRELVDGLNGDIAVPAIVRAGMSHLNLVMIHPFRDGNGRMARVLQSLVLAREGFLSPVFASIEEHLGRNTQAYYDVLALVGGGSWSPGNDARPWLRFTLAAHWLQARRVLRRAQESERLWDMLERIAEDRRLPERSLPALLDAVVGLRLRNATYRAIVEEVETITDATASRDLAKLVDADVLEPRGERRGRSYVRGPLLSAAWAEITDARDQADEPGPFADAPGPFADAPD